MSAFRPWLIPAFLLFALPCFAFAADQQVPPGEDHTPPRLSFIDGQASFHRAGAPDWAPARVNTPLASGDAMYTSQRANLEVQFGPRAFVRAAENTELGLVNVEPDFLQFELKGGTASLDLRSLPSGYSVELDTPNAVFTIEHTGYYRVQIEADATHFITRRSGRATVSVEDGPAQSVSPSEEIVVRGTQAPVVQTYVAPQLDAWDRWNYARTDYEAEALSARYVSPGVYGVGALDQYGAWRVTPAYGPVWVPDRMPAGWAPYSTGSWMWDPHYGWTWVDDVPWGWAPYHYGRWVSIEGIWAWAPGPVIARPLYAPALVAFFGIAPDVSVSIGIGGAGVGWVALGWGEPLRPWWGRPGFVGVPWWGGWGGPRIVNNVVIERNTVVNVNTIVYRNTQVRNAVVAVGERQFGAGHVAGRQFAPREPRELQPIGEAHPVRPGPESLAATRGEGVRPPAQMSSRSVVATRPPRGATLPSQRGAPAATQRAQASAPRIVTPPKQPEAAAALPRPSFGEKGPERPREARPPRYQELRQAPETAQRAAPSAQQGASAPNVQQRAAPPPARQRPAPSAAQGASAPRAQEHGAAPAAGTRREAPQAKAPRALPGQPANQMFPRRAEGGAGKGAAKGHDR